MLEMQSRWTTPEMYTRLESSPAQRISTRQVVAHSHWQVPAVLTYSLASWTVRVVLSGPRDLAAQVRILVLTSKSIAKVMYSAPEAQLVVISILEVAYSVPALVLSLA